MEKSQDAQKSAILTAQARSGFTSGVGLVLYLGFADFKFEEASVAQCPTCSDGAFDCPPVCPFIPPGGTSEQAMAMLADDEPEVFDGDW